LENRKKAVNKPKMLQQEVFRLNNDGVRINAHQSDFFAFYGNLPDFSLAF